MNSMQLTETDGGVLFKVKVQPRSSKNEICGLQGDAVKIRLTAPPVQGEANEACIRFLAETLGLPRQRIKIVTGHQSSHKIIRIEGINRAELSGLIDDLLNTSF